MNEPRCASRRWVSCLALLMLGFVAACNNSGDEGAPAPGAVPYGSSTALITWMIPFDAEMSVAAMPAAESASRVSVPPLSIW